MLAATKAESLRGKAELNEGTKDQETPRDLGCSGSRPGRVARDMLLKHGRTVTYVHGCASVSRLRPSGLTANPFVCWTFQWYGRVDILSACARRKERTHRLEPNFCTLGRTSQMEPTISKMAGRKLRNKTPSVIQSGNAPPMWWWTRVDGSPLGRCVIDGVTGAEVQKPFHPGMRDLRVACTGSVHHGASFKPPQSENL